MWSLTKLPLIRLAAALLPGLLVAPAAWSGAWLQPPGEGQLITTVTYDRADHRFDQAGNRIEQPEFTKLELSPYLEYGLSRDLTLVAQTYLQQVTVGDGEGNERTTSGFQTAVIGLRAPLHRGARTALSVQPSIRLPLGYDEDADPALGSGEVDAELALLYGGNFEIMRRPAFYDLLLGYRWRGGEVDDEIRPELTLGVQASPRWLLLAQSFNIVGSGQTRRLNQTGQRSHKLQLSAVRRLGDNLSVQFGGFTTIDGRDFIQENALIFGLWWRF